jgi:outer membrane protein assembly factor BamD (BamD/ComL family)
VVYLMLAWRGSADAIVGRIDPIDRIKFVAPWVLAVVAAGVSFALVLVIARLVDYRPGAITPLLAIMFALPFILFEFNVGRDELYYRLLERRNRAHFADVDASLAWLESARRSWDRLPLPRPSWEATQQRAAQQWLFELADDLAPYESAASQHVLELTEECDRFLTRFPDSRYAPNVLYIKARAMSMRIDANEFRRSKWIRFYDDFPNAASRETWRIILANRPDSPLGAVAGLRLAQLNARDGQVERARDQLRTLIQRFGDRSPVGPHAAESGGSLGSVLARGAPESSLDIPLDRIVLEAHRLYALFSENRDPLYGYDPISGPPRTRDGVSFGLADLDPRHGRYTEHLKALLDRYPHCQIEDNIMVELAKAEPDKDKRIAMLNDCLRRFPDRDEVPEAMFRLAEAYRDAGRAGDATPVLTKLAERFPDSIWARQASERRLRVSTSLLTRANP